MEKEDAAWLFAVAYGHFLKPQRGALCFGDIVSATYEGSWHHARQQALAESSMNIKSISLRTAGTESRGNREELSSIPCGHGHLPGKAARYHLHRVTQDPAPCPTV